jgi:hypothetical protein
VATTKDGGVTLVMVSALVVASSVTVAFIWLEAIVDSVASTVPLASSVGPKTPVNMSHGTGSAVCWCSDCTGCGDPVPGPRIDWYNRTIQSISIRLGLNGVAAAHQYWLARVSDHRRKR